MVKAKAKWIGNFRSVVGNTRAHSVVCDLPTIQDGEDTGPTALELAVMALADCALTIYSKVAKNSKVELTDLEVEAEAEKAADSPKITQVTLKVKVAGKARKQLLEAMWRRTEANCPVVSIFKDPVPVKVELEIESAQ